MKRLISIWLTLTLSLCLFSCKTIDLGYVKKSTLEKELATMQADYQAKLEASNKSIIESNREVIAAKDAQIQAVADAFYGQSVVAKSIALPSRADLIMINLSEEGWQSIDHLMPSYEQMMKINERITKELDETKTSLADLQKSHDAVLAQNAQLTDREKAAEAKAAEAQREKDNLRQEYIDAMGAKQKELDAANDNIIANEKARADSSRARQAQIAKLSWGAGILAALCLAAALFSPVFKTELGIASGVLAAAAVGVLFIEPWMVLVGFGLIAAGIIIWALYRFHRVDKTNSALINRDNDIAQSNPQVYKDVIAPATAAYATKYVKQKDGTITTVPDPSITQQIDSKLIATDRK